MRLSAPWKCLLFLTVAVSNFIAVIPVTNLHQVFLLQMNTITEVFPIKQGKVVAETIPAREAGVNLIYCRQIGASLSFHVA